MKPDLHAPEFSLYTLKDIPGKGKGLLASRSISRGSCIISEPPLFTTETLEDPATFEKDLGAIVRSLPKEGQRAFLSLHNNNPGKDPFSNIVRSNGYPLGPNSEVGGVFPLIARINHSCRPNAQHVWNEKLKREQVHAIRDLAAGDELTLSYSAGGPSKVRKQALKDHFGFDCACEVCSLPADELKVSDQRLEKAQKLDEGIGNPKRVKMLPEKVLNDCHALLEIYQQEQIYDLRLPRLYYDAFQISAMHSDQARARLFAKRSREAREVCEGLDSAEVKNLKGLEEKPSSFENFGVTKKWKSAVDDVPSNLDDDAFERWLWKEEP